MKKMMMTALGCWMIGIGCLAYLSAPAKREAA